MFPWHQYLLGLIMILSGFNHFRAPKKYENLIPSFFPAPSSMVLLSGIIEMILGLMLLTQESQKLAAWGIMIMTMLYLTVPFYMLKQDNESIEYPKWIWLLCIIIQFGFLGWASIYT